MGRREANPPEANPPADPPVRAASVTIVGLLLLLLGVLLALASAYVLLIDDGWIKNLAKAIKITKPVELSNFVALIITIAGSLCIAAFNSATSLKAAWDDPNKILRRSDLILTYAFGIAAAIISSLVTFLILRAGVAAGSGELLIASFGSPDESTGGAAFAAKLIYFIVGVGAGATPPRELGRSAIETAAKVTKRVGQSLSTNTDSLGQRD
jgi:hypothetical protein